MNAHINICEPMLVNRFIDGEVNAHEWGVVTAHIQNCIVCRAFVTESRKLKTLANDGIEDFVERQPLNHIDACVRRLIIHKTHRHRKKLKYVVLKKWFLIPTMAMLLSIFFYFVSSQVMEMGPSAIVTSVEGDVSSVVIMETPDTHQTIIWFKESNRLPNTL